MRSVSCQGLYKQVVENGLAADSFCYVRVKNPFHLSRDEFVSWEFSRLYGNSTRNWVGYRHLVRPINTPCHALPAWNSHMRVIKGEKAISQGDISSSRQSSARWRWIVPDVLSPIHYYFYSSLKLSASTPLAAYIKCCGLTPSPGLHTSVRCAAAPAALGMLEGCHELLVNTGCSLTVIAFFLEFQKLHTKANDTRESILL